VWLHYFFSPGLLCDDYIGDINDITRIIYCDYTRGNTRTYTRTFTRGNTRGNTRTFTRGNTRTYTRGNTRTITREAPAP